MIFLFDKFKKLKGTVRNRHTISLLYERERNGLYTVSAEIPLKITDKKTVYNYHKKVKDSDFLGHYDREGRFQLHKIASVDIEDSSIFIKGVHLFFDEAKAGAIIQERRFRDSEIIDGARVAFDSIGWSVVDFDISDTKDYIFYNVSPLEARAILVETFGYELDYWLDFDGKNIRNKQISVKREMGKESNKRYNYGHNVLNIKVEQDYSEIYTAVIGRGKGEDLGDDAYGRRIEYTDVVWKTPTNPMNKPKGSRVLHDENATQLFGYHEDGKVSPRTKVEIFEDIEDPRELLQASYEWLKENSVPKAVFSLEVPDGDGLDLGDKVHVIYRDIDLVKHTRVTKVIDDLVGGNRDVEFGDTAYFKTDRRLSGVKSELKRVGGSMSSRISRLKAEFDERFKDEVQQMHDDFDQAIIDANASTDAKMEAHKELWEQKNAEIDDAIRRIIGGDVSVLDTNILDMRQMLSRKLEESDLEAIRQGLASTEEDLELTRQNLQEQLEEAEKGTEQKFSTVNQTISTIEGELSSKVEQAEVDTLKGTVDNHSTTLTQQATLLESKADQESLNTLEGTVTKQGTTLRQTAQELASKADTSELNTLKGTVSTQGTLLSQTSQELKAKANTSTVDTLTGRVSSAESAISIQASRVTGLLSTQSEHESKITSLVASSEEVSSTVGSISRDLTSVKSDVSSVKQTASGLRQEVTALDKDVGSLQSWRSEKGSLYDQTAESVRIKAWKSDIDAVNIGINNLIPLSDIVNWESASVPAEWRKSWGAGEVWPGRQNSKYILVRSNYDSIKAGGTFGIYSPHLTEDLIEGETYTLGFNTFSWTYTVFDYMYIMYDDHPNQNLATPKHDRYTYGWSDNGAKNVSYQTLTFTPNKSGKARIMFAKRIEEGEQTMFYINEPMLVKGNKLPVDFMPSQDDFIQQTDFVIQSDGFLLGTRKMGGDKFASAIVGNSIGLKLIGDNIDVTGNLNVQKSVKAWSLESVTANISSIRSDILKSNVVLSSHLKVDSALANKFNANSAFISRLEVQAANIRDLTATDIKGGVLSSLNNSMKFNLINNHLEFNRDATIDFYSTNNALRMFTDSSTSDPRDIIHALGTGMSRSGYGQMFLGGGHYDIDGTVKANDVGFAGIKLGGNNATVAGSKVLIGSGGDDGKDQFFEFDFTTSLSNRYAYFRPTNTSDNFVIGSSNRWFHSMYTWRLNGLRFYNPSGNIKMGYDNGSGTGASWRFFEDDIWFDRGGTWSMKQAITRANDAYNSINDSNGLQAQIRSLASRVYALERK